MIDLTHCSPEEIIEQLLPLCEEQETEIEQLEAKIEQLKQEIAHKTTQIDELKTQIDELLSLNNRELLMKLEESRKESKSLRNKLEESEKEKKEAIEARGKDEAKLDKEKARYKQLIDEEESKIIAESKRRADRLAKELAEKKNQEIIDEVNKGWQEIEQYAVLYLKEESKVEALKVAYPMVTAFSVIYGMVFTAMTAAFNVTIVRDTVEFWSNIYIKLSEIPAAFGANSTVCIVVGIILYVLLGGVVITGVAMIIKKKWDELPHKISVTVLLADVALIVAYAKYISPVINIWVPFLAILAVYLILAAGGLKLICDKFYNLRYKAQEIEFKDVLAVLFPVVVIIFVVTLLKNC